MKNLEDKGFEVDKKVKKYNINENIFGVTISGSEIDEQISCYALGGTWEGKDAEAFIKFYGLQQKIAAKGSK